MKQIGTFLIFIFLFFTPFTAKADHITGGEMYYTYVGFSNGQHQYNVTLKFFKRCNSGRQFNNPAIVSIFNKITGSRVRDLSVSLSREETIRIADPDPCITNPPTVCYEVGYYDFQVSLPSSADGYLLASQVNFRISGINNLTPGYSQIGATYTAEIPGTNPNSNGVENNSARFIGNDLVVVCANNNFSYSFAAEDKDGDQLRYSFCNAYRSGITAGGNAPIAAPNPPYQEVPYGSGFNGSSPLGSPSINPTTGLITGIAPSEGPYVVTVCVQEIRNGNVIATQRKDLQINIAPCTVAGALLLPEYQLCHDSKTITIANLSSSPLIRTQDWEFSIAENTVFKSTGQPVSYTFPDTGLYTVKLIINRGGSCSDSTTALIRVYPGFVPDFTFSGICLNRPTIFKDATTTVYGAVNSWQWNFGDPNAAPSPINSDKTPAHTYISLGPKDVQLIVNNINGCKDTIQKTVTIIDKPVLTLAFKDSLICIKDNVQLQASGNGNFSWTPTANLSDANSRSPIASPKQNTTYEVTLDDNGCVSKDAVTIRVTDKVQLQVMNDTTICKGDTIQLRTVSDGFTYSWSPAAQVNNATLASPFAVTNTPTTYEVVASIGSCTAREQIVVTPVPYPIVNAGPDVTICYGTTTQLAAQTNGAKLIWAPTTTLSNTTIPDPIASPLKTTNYILTVTDTKGCPKPSFDTVVVNVLADIEAFAGRDTAVIMGQALQLNASNGAAYSWSPALSLSATNIRNPIGTYTLPSEGIRYRLLIYNEEGCVDSAFITVKVFSTKPSVFVPTGFTPNGDNKNDVLKPIAVGIKSIVFFHVYNRWGQLVFSTTENGSGWDGRINGKLQSSNTFVWVVKAIDYNGNTFVEKGTSTLIQ